MLKAESWTIEVMFLPLVSSTGVGLIKMLLFYSNMFSLTYFEQKAYVALQQLLKGVHEIGSHKRGLKTTSFMKCHV